MNRVRKYKRILAAVLIILLSAGAEFVFNYHAVSEGYEELELTQYTEVLENKEKQQYVLEYQCPEGLYVKQLNIEGTFSGADYTVECTVLNDFGKEEEYSVKDSVHAWFTKFYTNLNKKITSLKITIPKDSDSELRAVSVSNQIEFNKYRFIFVLITLALLYCIFFEPVFRKKPEYFFLLFSLTFGGLLLLGGQPQRNVWDEQIHFQNAYRLASGRVVEWNEAAERMGTAKTPKCNTKAEYAQLRKAMDKKGEEITVLEENRNLGLSFNSFGYLPSALFLRLGMWMHLPFSNLILFGRMGNLLAYICAMFWAIRLAGRRKLFLLFISLMPTSLFLAGSYTYDSVVFSFVSLGVVLWANEMSEQNVTARRWPLLLSVFLIVAGGMAKIVYVPLALIWVLAPQIKQLSRKKKTALGAVVSAVCVIVGLFVLIRWLLPVMNGEIIFADSRGGETNLAAQLVSMLRHPWESIKMFVREILSLDNFRNTGIAEYNNYFVGNLMFLNYNLMGVMPDKWCILLLPVLTILLLYRENETEKTGWLRRGQQIFVLAVLMVVIVLIWASMYLVFTPVGDANIAGVQARYYLPLLYLAALVIQNKRVYLNAGYGGIVKMAMTSALVLEAVSVYSFILQNRLF